jgi:electron transport complex protein RnfC
MTEAIQGDGRLAGGLVLPARKATSTAAPILQAPLPDWLVHPVEALSGGDTRPAVSVGERVLRGQPLVTAAAGQPVIAHAGSSGIVRAIEPRPVADARRTRALCVVIEVDGRDERLPTQPPSPGELADPATLAARLAEAGLAGLGGAAFPTGRKLAGARAYPLKALLLNAAECEPYISCDDMLLRERADEVIAGTLAMLDFTACPAAIVALEDDKPEALAAVEAAVACSGAAERVSIVTVPTIYPSGGERQLIALVTGEEVPSGGYPPDIGYLCHNVGTAAALARFLATGEPLTSRIVTVTGGGVARPRNLEARLGTPVAALVAACGGYREGVVRLVMGGGMTGLALASDEVPVTRSSNCLIAATAAEIRQSGDELPCIRCGDCAEACPAGLVPQLLHWHGRHRDDGELDRLGLFDCIECGCCDLVCPSHIPLTAQFREDKRRVWQQRLERERAGLAEQRHAARGRRLADEEAAREAARERQRTATRDPAASAAAIAEILRRKRGDRDGGDGS